MFKQNFNNNVQSQYQQTILNMNHEKLDIGKLIVNRYKIDIDHYYCNYFLKTKEQITSYI